MRELILELVAGVFSFTKENTETGSHSYEHPRTRFGNGSNTSGIRRPAARGRQLR